MDQTAAVEASPTAKYHETLLLYYEEEIMGEAYFRAVADRLEAPEHKRKMTLLAEVERHAAEITWPVVARHALTPRPRAELDAIGRAEAAETKVAWDALMLAWSETFPKYIESFKSLEAMAPTEDLPALELLTEHEVAAIEFLNLERAGDADSAAPLRAYLQRGLT